jgi:hypothetical protein
MTPLGRFETILGYRYGPTDSPEDRRGEFFRGRQEGGVPTFAASASRRCAGEGVA